jgi:hypothetical protein
MLPGYPDTVRLIVELHRAFLDMPIFDATWLASQPDLQISEFAAMIKLAHTSLSRPFAASYQQQPWSRLQPTLVYLRGMTVA